MKMTNEVGKNKVLKIGMILTAFLLVVSLVGNVLLWRAKSRAMSRTESLQNSLTEAEDQNRMLKKELNEMALKNVENNTTYDPENAQKVLGAFNSVWNDLLHGRFDIRNIF